jgi:hypothetical protein
MLGAIIGGALSLGGAILGGNSQKKAAQSAADTSLAVAQQNNALARDIYSQNQSALAPYMQRGNAAGNQINALLGLGSMPGGVSGYGDGSGLPGTGSQWSAYYNANPDLQAEFNSGRTRFDTPDAYAQWHYQNYGQNEGRQIPSAPSATPAAGSATAAQNAFDVFRNSTGYQFRLGEGMNALNSGYAGAGLVRSGAAMKAAQEYGQNLASGEFGNYLGYLSNQQGVGLGGASALAGVGQNYTNTVSANNNSAGTAAANAALVKGANNPFANALSLIGGGVLGYGR